MLRELVICGVLASVAAATVATEDRLSFDLHVVRVIRLTASFDSRNWLSFVSHVGNTIDVGVPSFVRANCPIPSNAWTGRERGLSMLKPLHFQKRRPCSTMSSRNGQSTGRHVGNTDLNASGLMNSRSSGLVGNVWMSWSLNAAGCITLILLKVLLTLPCSCLKKKSPESE